MKAIATIALGDTIAIGTNCYQVYVMSEVPKTFASQTVTLTVAGWSSNTQTVTITSITGANDILVSPSADSYVKYASAQIRATSRTDTTVTFTCTTTPTVELTASVKAFA